MSSAEQNRDGPPRAVLQSAPGQALSRNAAWLLALTATLTMAVSYLDRQTLAVLAPTVTKALSISETAYGWLISSFSIAYLVAAPFAGVMIDRVGARRGLVGAVLLWSIVAALHAPVPTIAALFALRIALGVTESPSFPGAAQTVQRALPPADRARGFGVLFTGSSIGAMIAPPLATFLEARWGWRVAFLGTAVVGLCWLPVWFAIAFRPAARRALDRGTSAAPEGRGSPSPDTEVRTKASGGTSAWTLLGHPAVLRGVIVIIAMSPISNFIFNWGAKYLVNVYGLTQQDVGKLLFLPPLFFDAGAIGFGHLASVRAGARGYDGSPPRVVFGIAALTMAGAGAFMPFASSPIQFVLMAGLLMAGAGGVIALNTADMMGRVPPGVVSTVGGITAAAQSLAYIIASPLTGWLKDHQVTYPAIAFWLAAWVVPGCLIWLVWSPPPLVDRAAPASETDGQSPSTGH
jgi:MFS transporter, ACS family, hexuronate transporter